MEILTTTVLGIQIKNPIRESHLFEIQIPPRSTLQRHLTHTKKSSYNFHCLKCPNGILQNKSHTLALCIRGSGIQMDFRVLPYSELMFFTIDSCELHLYSKGVLQKVLLESFVDNGIRLGYRCFISDWKVDWTHSVSSDWNNEIDSIKILISFQCELDEKLTKFPPGGKEIREEDSAIVSKTVNPSDYLLSHSLSDVELICKGQIFPAHRIILSCKSPVFKSMFEVEMKESLEGRVLIEDIEPEVLSELLRYIYTEEIEFSSSEITFPLFEAADKYNLETLKKKCTSQIATTISIENALEIYSFGISYNEKYLCDKAFEYMKLEKLAVAENAEKLSEMCKRFPQLMFELYKM